MKENKIILTSMVIVSIAALIVALTAFWIYGLGEIVIELKNKITLEHISKIIQILFYIVGSIVAVKTYLSAKKGLLNTVNTEYQKKVIIRLEELSNKLYDEFNPDSETYWAKQSIENSQIGKYVISYLENGKEGVFPGVLMPNRIEVLESILNEVKSDPFIPETISNYIVEHIQSRVDGTFDVYFEEGNKFIEELNTGKYKHIETIRDWDNLLFGISNIINRKLYEKQCGISQVEEQIHGIRVKIREYLKSYDPFSKEPWYKLNKKK